MGETSKYVCCYCGKDFIGWGNNPDTWNGTNWTDEDRCCDDCNEHVVLPGRIAVLLKRGSAK